jgi:hypothetical protein
MRWASTLLLLSCTLGTSACASLQVDPKNANAGTFRSTAVSFTFLGFDYPQSAILVARANAADSQLANLVVEEERIFPYFWRLDFLLDIVSFRWAKVSGTYGPAN